jgi:hypothetical protein
VAGTYELSAKRWVADKSNTDNKQCQHSKSITVSPKCHVQLKDETGYEVSIKKTRPFMRTYCRLTSSNRVRPGVRSALEHKCHSA